MGHGGVIWLDSLLADLLQKRSLQNCYYPVANFHDIVCHHYLAVFHTVQCSAAPPPKHIQLHFSGQVRLEKVSRGLILHSQTLRTAREPSRPSIYCKAFLYVRN